MESPADQQASYEDLRTNPDYFLWRFDGPNAIFARMNRETYQQSIFTDQRIIASDPKPIRVDLDDFAQHFSKQPEQAPAPSFIFHVAHCGSTLLARALDQQHALLVYREPYVLRQLAVLHSENNWGNSPPKLWSEALKLATTLLSKSYDRAIPPVIKANVPVNFIIDPIMAIAPLARGILLYSTFENYLLSILKSTNHRDWVVNISSTLKNTILDGVQVSPSVHGELSVPRAAASLWLAQLLAFNALASRYPALKTLDSELFFSDPAAVLPACFQHFGSHSSVDLISDITASDLFSRHAKVPGQAYDNQQRLQEKQELERALADDLREARDWLQKLLERMPLPASLANPLLGESPELYAGAALPGSAGSPPTGAAPDDSPPYAVFTAASGKQALSDLDDARIIDAYKTRGAILFRGFDYDIDEFSTFVKRFCRGSAYNPSHGRLTIDEKNNIQTVDPGSEAFPLHAELCREPWRPDACFFACESAPTSGGETTLCDGVKIVEALDEHTLAQLQSQPLLYFQPMSEEDCQHWLNTTTRMAVQLASPPDGLPFKLTYVDGQLSRMYSAPTLHRTMFGGQLAFGNFLLFSRYGLNNRLQPCFADGSIVPDEAVEKVKQVSDALLFAHRWQTGDLLMLDNTRFLHGRNAIADSGERKIMSYFGYLDFAELSPEEARASWRNVGPAC